MKLWGIDVALGGLIGLLYGLIVPLFGWDMGTPWFWVGLAVSAFVINTIFLHFYKE